MALNNDIKFSLLEYLSVSHANNSKYVIYRANSEVFMCNKSFSFKCIKIERLILLCSINPYSAEIVLKTVTFPHSLRIRLTAC